jgi:hypothetical protein
MPPVGLSGEGTAALLGAVAGGGIAIVGQAVFGSFGAFRARRVAAQVIFAELVSNLATVLPALDGSGWSATKPEALRAAWDTYGARLLLPWHRAHDVGAVASAYNRVDDIAWLAVNNYITVGQNYGAHLGDIYTGMLVVGRASGYSDLELAARGVPVDQVSKALAENRANARRLRRESRRNRLKAIAARRRV